MKKVLKTKWKHAKAVCVYCKKEFSVYPYRIENTKYPVKYCSNMCRGIASHKKTKLICKHCSQEFERWPSDIKWGKGKYCSKECQHWRDEKSFEPYTVDWTKTLRRSIRERDHYTCQLCGTLQLDDAFCVHHKDYNKKNSSSENLITLCKRCHAKTNYNRNYWINYFEEQK